jgi:hypothetical protein
VHLSSILDHISLIVTLAGGLGNPKVISIFLRALASSVSLFFLIFI